MLTIRNTGEIEHEALVLMGATSKEGDDTKIGFFGSGNKYAIATLLRKGIAFRIYSGEREIPVTTKPVSLRGVAYEQIVIDGVATSLTTRMGPDWETWFALREFVCNAIDEGGYEMAMEDDVTPREGTTLIAIEKTLEVEEFYQNHKQYIRNDEPMFRIQLPRHGSVGVYPNNGFLNIYRKGVSIVSARDNIRSMFSYAIDNVDITESRTLKYEWEARFRIAQMLARLTDKDLLLKFLRESHGYYEENLYWGAQCTASYEFTETWREALTPFHVCPRGYLRNVAPEDHSCYIELQEELYEHMLVVFPDLDYVSGSREDGGWTPQKPTEDEMNKLDAALETLAKIGFVTAVAKITFGTFTSPNTVAQYHRGKNEIRLSVNFLNDADDLVLTLMEEVFHARGYNDGSRKFEYHLMDELFKARMAFVELRNKVKAAVA